MQFSSPNGTVIMGCEMTVSITPESLTECLNYVVVAHPVLKKCLQIDAENSAEFIEYDGSWDIYEYEECDNATIYSEHLKEKWLLEAPLIRFVLNHFRGYCQLIICANHAACDGLSIVYLLEDIAAFMQKKIIPSSADFMQLHPQGLQEKFAFWPFKLFAYFMHLKWRKIPFHLTSELIDDLHRAYWENHAAAIKSILLDQDLTSFIIDQAKKESVTVNTYITWMLLDSHRESTSGDRLDQILMSVDLRKKITPKPGRQLGYFVTAIPIKFARLLRKRGFNLQKWQREIQRKLKGRSLFKSLALYFFDASFFDLIQLNKLRLRHDGSLQAIVAKEASQVKYAMSITNLGVLSVKRELKEIVSSFLPLAVVSDTVEKYVSVFTYNGKMHITFCYDSTIVAQINIEDLKSNLLSKLSNERNRKEEKNDE